MSERKWTKGPWSVTDNSWEVSTVYAPNGNAIAECHIDSDVTEDTQDVLEPIKEANARLIAAAPDLYEALEKLLDPSTDMLAHAGNVRKARTALAKASP